MALEIIGAGFGRTGTMSLRDALEILGFGPCHHMAEVFGKPEAIDTWEAIADGAAPDWDSVFAGYRSQCDWPGAAYWRELAAHYPEAKVILSVRPADGWHRSVMGTIARFMVAEPDHPTEDQNRLTRMAHKLVNRNIFGGRVEDAGHAMAIFEENTRAVQDAIAPERLLVYEVGSGWEPLCRFLGVPVPDMPYPSKNSTSEFRQRQADA